MKIGDKLRGTITGIQPYGAFVELESGITGLIHISEIKTGYIENIHDRLVKKFLFKSLIMMNIVKKPVFLCELWKKKNIAYLSVIAFRMTVISLALHLLLRVFRLGLRKPFNFYLSKKTKKKIILNVRMIFFYLSYRL